MAPHERYDLPAKAGRRMSHSQVIWTMSVILTLLLTSVGGPVALAQDTPPPTPTAGPLSPEELKLLEEARQEVEPVDYPYFPGGYPSAPVFEPAGTPDASAAGVDALGSWIEEKFCIGAEQCLVGDFNGDNRDDVAVLYRDTRPEPERGDVRVALSGGGFFSPSTKWLEGPVCTGNHLCKAGDANGDGKDDIIIFHRGRNEPGAGQVDVAISTGSRFLDATAWHPQFCMGDEICDIGDFDGINGVDLIVFYRSSSEDLEGDVRVARSRGLAGGFGNWEPWHSYFCVNGEECRVGDFNGDNRDDIALFRKGNGDLQGRVDVAPSLGSYFGSSKKWADYFCILNEQCEIGNFDGDPYDDLLAFLRDGYSHTPSTYGDTYVTLSAGNAFYNSQRWNDMLCIAGQDCFIGDFNGDNQDDVVRFVKQSPDPSRVGLVLVALASGVPGGFVKTPPPDGLWLTGFCTGSQTCVTGDFNGDNLDDVAYLVRNTQSGTGTGDVYVALSTGSQFVPPLPSKWHDDFCVGTDVCKVGDFNGDNRDDILAFSRSSGTYGKVFVILADTDGSGFGIRQEWHNFFCVNQEWCEVGDFNGDNRTDIALFIRSAYGDTSRVGDVEVATSTGFNFEYRGLWHNFFCVEDEWCHIGDFNGDNLDDVITFTKGGHPRVYVELSNGGRFGDGNAPAELWHDFFCGGDEVCDTGDFDGNGYDDVITFLRNSYPSYPETIGDVVVGLSTGSAAAGGFIAQPKWLHGFCITASETCEMGYFNGDRIKDIAAFARGSSGNVYVAIGAVGRGFVDTAGAPPESRYVMSLLIRRTGQ